MIRLAGICVAVVSLLLWLAFGANRGWTKTTIDKPQTDTVTGLEYPVREQRFVPGIDLLGLCWMVAAVLLGVSFIPITRRKQNNSL